MSNMGRNARDVTEWSKVVADTVRAERAASKKTQQEVFTAAGVKRSTYIRIESGSHVADVGELAKIARVFGLPLSKFLERAEARLEENGTAST